MTTMPATTSDELDALRAEVRELRSQLDNKTRIAARAMATYQQRVLKMEERAAELRAANEEVRRINDRLSETLTILEQRERVITHDMEQAQRFQQLILPRPPTSDRVRFAVFYRPAELVGGDVYDIYERSPGEFRVFVADATGHGVQAALRTMLLKAEYDRLKDANSPEQTLVALNARITASYPGLEMQCSASCFDIQLGAGGTARVRYATAAHPPLLVFRDGDCSSIYRAGPFLGVSPEISLDAVDLELAAGHRLLIYSDGLEEQWNAANEEFGLDRVKVAIGDRERDLAGAVDRLVADWTEFLAGDRPDDDATLVAVECLD